MGKSSVGRGRGHQSIAHIVQGPIGLTVYVTPFSLPLARPCHGRNTPLGAPQLWRWLDSAARDFNICCLSTHVYHTSTKWPMAFCGSGRSVASVALAPVLVNCKTLYLNFCDNFVFVIWQTARTTKNNGKRENKTRLFWKRPIFYRDGCTYLYHTRDRR